MRPYDIKNENQACEAVRTHKDYDEFWILTDGYNVSLAHQKIGEPATESIRIPRSVFNKMVDWYMREQKSKITKAA